MLAIWDYGCGTGSGTYAPTQPDAAEVSGAQSSLTSTFRSLRPKLNPILDDVYSSPSSGNLAGPGYHKQETIMPLPGAVSDQHP